MLAHVIVLLSPAMCFFYSCVKPSPSISHGYQEICSSQLHKVPRVLLSSDSSCGFDNGNQKLLKSLFYQSYALSSPSWVYLAEVLVKLGTKSKIRSQDGNIAQGEK